MQYEYTYTKTIFIEKSYSSQKTRLRATLQYIQHEHTIFFTRTREGRL